LGRAVQKWKGVKKKKQKTEISWVIYFYHVGRGNRGPCIEQGKGHFQFRNQNQERKRDKKNWFKFMRLFRVVIMLRIVGPKLSIGPIKRHSFQPGLRLVFEVPAQARVWTYFLLLIFSKVIDILYLWCHLVHWILCFTPKI
jgi:hypothetical protein